MSNNNSMATKDLLTLDNPVFCCYLFWATVLVVKMLLMSLLTTLQRFRYKVSFKFQIPIKNVSESTIIPRIPQLLGLIPLSLRRKVKKTLKLPTPQKHCT